MNKKSLKNDIYTRLYDFEVMKKEMASLETPMLDIDEFNETVKKQGFDFLLDNTTITFTDAILHHIEHLEMLKKQAKELLITTIDASMEHDTSKQRAAKQDIIKKYNAYMASLG